MAEHYYTVGVHGAPTPETAPHGYGYRRPGHRWTFGYLPATVNIDAEWYPLPAPPTEQAPPPEPVARWAADTDHGTIYMRRANSGLSGGAEWGSDALNALDRDGVCWGPGRPMSELPETGRVLVESRAGDLHIVPVPVASGAVDGAFRCWWPLPESGE